jgi:hypothetical protein
VTAPIDVSGYIGQVRRVTEPETGRVVTVTVGDAGPLRAAAGRKLWDGRPMLALTVSFDDGKRSDWRTADAAAGQVAEELFKPFTVGMLGGDGWEPRIDRTVRKGGPKNGRTSFTIYVWQGPPDRTAEIEQRAADMRERNPWLTEEACRRKAVEAVYAEVGAAARAGGEHVPATYDHRAATARREAHAEAMAARMAAARR